MSRQNNPFGPSPTSQLQQTAQKYPDISGDPSLQANQPQHQQEFYQQQQYQQQQYQQPQQQPPAFLQSAPTGFQPQTSLGGSYGGGGGAYGGAGGGAYGGGTGGPYGQQPQQQQSQYPSPQVSFSVTDLDPYANLGSLHQSHAGAQGAGAGGRTLPASLTSVQQAQSHPRQYVHENKAGVSRLPSAFRRLRTVCANGRFHIVDGLGRVRGALESCDFLIELSGQLIQNRDFGGDSGSSCLAGLM